MGRKRAREKQKNSPKSSSDEKRLGLIGKVPTSDTSPQAKEIRVYQCYLLKISGADRHSIMKQLGISKNTYTAYMKEIGKLEIDSITEEAKGIIASILGGLNRQILRLETKQQTQQSDGREETLLRLRKELREAMQSLMLLPKAGEKMEFSTDDDKPMKVAFVIESADQRKRLKDAINSKRATLQADHKAE